jgi:two-component system LytT family response regulator
MKPIRTFVVDDEAPARKRIVELLAREPDVEIAGEFEGGADALAAISRAVPDLLFLDVQMPDVDGFSVHERLPSSPRPVVVFVTAYDTYALDAFEVNALDYLLKPFSDERFEATLGRIRERLRAREREALAEKFLSLASDNTAESLLPERLAVRSTGRVVFVDVADIDWVEAAGVYVTIHEGGREHLLRESLASLEGKLDAARFARIHRSALVALDRVSEIHTDDKGTCRAVLRNGTSLPLSRRHKLELEERLNPR